MKTLYTKIIILGLLSLMTTGLSFGQLAAGDIAFVQYNADGFDNFAFVVLTDISAGTIIHFTDNEPGDLGGGEGTITWTAPSGGVTPNTVVTITTTPSATTGTVTERNDLNFGSGGDGLWAFTGTSGAPSFTGTPTYIAALGNDGSANAIDTGSEGNISGTGLTEGTNAVGLAEVDNAVYNGLFSGTKTALLTAINDHTNWVGNNNINQTFNGAINCSDCSSSGPICSIAFTNLANINCNDNGTASDSTDDITSFTLNPTGVNLGTTYTVDMDGFANISTNISGPFTTDVATANYGSTTTFYLEPGSAGIGSALDALVIDDTDTNCSAIATVTDPGSCSTAVPSITLSETTLSGLDYVDGSGPSTEQSFTTEGSNLTADITITAPTNFEVSTTSGSGFGSSVTLTQSGGTVATTTIFVRLAASLAVNTYSGTLSATSTGAIQQDVSLSGEVTAPSCAGTSIAFPFTGVSGSTNLEHSSSNLPLANGDESCGTNYLIYYTTAPATDGSTNFLRSNTVDGLIESEDWGGEGNFETFAIDVSGETSVDIETFGTTTGNGFNAGGEELQWWYKLDGGAQINLGSPITGTGSLAIGPTTVDVTSVSNIIVGFTFNMNGGSDGFEDVDVRVTAPSCNISSIGLTNITCNDNGTPMDVSDDIRSFELNPTGNILGATYSVDMDGFANISTSISGPFNSDVISGISYGSGTVFYLEPGTAGDGNDLDIIVIDVNDSNCFEIDTVTDPGSCSVNPNLITIAIEDFDGTSPSWPNDIEDQTFVDPDSSDEGLFIQASTNIGSGNTAFGSDLGGESGEPTLSPFTFTFEEVFVEFFSNVVLSFDYYAFANADAGSYQVIIDGVAQPAVEFYNDPDTTPVQGTISINIGTATSIGLIIDGTLNGGGDVLELDNFKIEGVFDGDSIYEGGAWSAGIPSTLATEDFVLVREGTYTTQGDITINGILVLGDATFEVRPQDVLTIGVGAFNNGTFVFQSDATESAQLGDATGVDIRGDITVERYMSANRAFRYVSSPVGGSQTIREAWQENASTGNPDPNPGFGTHITGTQGTVGNVNPTSGLDETLSGNPSLYTFNNTQQFYEPVTTTNVTLQAGTAYALFKRGDRSANLLDNLADGETTLRASGALLTGPRSSGTDFPALSTAVEGFSLVPNPYQAKVDFNALSFSGGVNPNFLYVFDPSAPNFGDFVVLENPTDASDMFIHPGQSFFVVNDTDPLNISTPAITFNEDDKATGSTPTTTVFNEGTLAMANLELYNANYQRLDMVKFRFDANASNGVDNFDALKIVNQGENIGRLINNKLYEIERRTIPQDNEVIPLTITQYQGTQYELRLATENWDEAIEVFVQDNYLNTTTPINVDQAYSFTVDASIPESIAADRFSLVFDNTTLGVNDNAFGTNFNVYPNPIKDGFFNITTPNLNGEVNLEISNIFGQVVKSSTANADGNKVNVDAQGFSSGVYLVKLTQNNQSYTAKVIVE